MTVPFLNASVDALISNLTLDEKILLLSGPNWWNTNRIERLEIPSVRMSDGPNGVRGSSHFKSSPAQCIPCATSLAATFDTELIHKVGQFLAEEAKLKSSVILLAPTCNIQRTPLGGRAFESFSEDPHLSGLLAAAYVNGLQSRGVAAAIKHLVANDQEHMRTAADSVMSERALREIYLYPFMLAERDAKPMAYMTAYGRINGVHCAENSQLLDGILRKEWGFDGLVMSDWYGTYSVAAALNNGLDLEMPGPPRWRTPLLINHHLTCQKILPKTIDKRAKVVVKFVQKLAALSPEVVYGDGVERTKDTPESRAFNREVAAAGMVLLKNQGSVLPLRPEEMKKIAVIGPNAQGRVISGGGSAYLKASYIVSPWQGLLSAVSEDVQMNHEVGCYAHKYLPTLEDKFMTPSGDPGWLCVFYSQNADGTLKDEVAQYILTDTRVKLNDFLPEGLGERWTIKLSGLLQVERTAPFEFGLTVAGRAKLFVNEALVIDNWTHQRPGEFFYGQGTVEEKATVELVANIPTSVLVEYTNVILQRSSDNNQSALIYGVRLGGAEKIDPDTALDNAVKLASESDTAILFVGLNHEWELEGSDRPNLSLPGRQAELIRRVGAVNKRTIVVVQAGSAVDMSWVDSVSGLVQAWYSGNEAGNAIADVLFGKINPSAKLPLTLPKREEDIPAYLSARCEHTKIHYREDIYVGYKWYLARRIEPQFPFGFGLSYTSFSMSNLQVRVLSESLSEVAIEASVEVKNIGGVKGSEVVQLYVKLAPAHVAHPSLQLRAFAKVHDLDPGESRAVTLHLDKYAVSYWDEPGAEWKVEDGEYEVHVGSSSVDLPLVQRFTLQKGWTWSGL